MGQRKIKKRSGKKLPQTETQLRDRIKNLKGDLDKFKKLNDLLEGEASNILEELVTGMKQLEGAVNDLGERVVRLEQKMGIEDEQEETSGTRETEHGEGDLQESGDREGEGRVHSEQEGGESEEARSVQS